MASTLFISDLHLDPVRPAVTRALAEFLASRTDCHQLYILGDLFEAWLGDDDDSPLAAEVRALLRNFTDAGPELYIMVGNRDFLLGHAFCDAVGAKLLPDPTLVDLHGQATLLMHGDSLCTADHAYQAFRREARDPAWQAQLLGQPLEERRQLAGKLRAMSREANSIKDEDIMDVTPGEAEREMHEHCAAQLIHGHTHRPAHHLTSSGSRWVLGAWEDEGWFIEASNGQLKLKHFLIYQ